MAGRGPQTFKKRQKEQERKEKQEEKRARRQNRQAGPRTDDDTPAPEPTAPEQIAAVE